MGNPGRPRKQQPYRPGASAPILAAGCGNERHLAAPRAQKRPGPALRLTAANGWRQDVLAIWRHRRKKGSAATVINDRQFLAGRRIEQMTQAIVDHSKLKSVDLTVPVVDTSFNHRLGGPSAANRQARAQLDRLAQRIGPRDLEFLMSVLGGMGIHGALLYEAGLEWRFPPDRDIDQRTGNTAVGRASGILHVGGAYRIDPNYAEGSFTVESATIPIHSRHKVPNENGFEVDKRATAEKAAKAAVRRYVSDKKREAKGDDPAAIDDVIQIAARALHSSRQPDARVDPDVADMVEMHRLNPPPGGGGHYSPFSSLGTAIDIGAVDHFEPWTTKDRAEHLFTTRQIELASQRCRDLLSRAADFFDTEDEQYNTVAPERIAKSDDVPFDVGIVRDFEDIAFEEMPANRR